MFELLLYSFLIMSASLIGVFSVWHRAGEVIERNLGLLVSFSAGVFLVIAYQLGRETIEHSQTIGFGLLWIITGALVFWLLFKFLPLSHHHHEGVQEASLHSILDVRRIMTSDALHNFGDGVILAASFAVSSALGIFTALSIFVHELIQEISEFFVLRQSGFSTKKALTLNFTISSTILLGALGGYFLLEKFEALEVPLLGLTAGAFLIVVLQDLIPHSVNASKETKHYLKHLVWFVFGIVLMLAVNILIPSH